MALMHNIALICPAWPQVSMNTRERHEVEKRKEKEPKFGADNITWDGRRTDKEASQPALSGPPLPS